MGAFHDFDAAWAEEDDEPVVLHNILGQDWTCKRPSEVPAALLLRLDRLLIAATTEQLPEDFTVDDDLSTEKIARALAGDTNVDAWLSQGLSYKRLASVIQRLLAIYRGQDPGEAPAANRATRRAATKKTAASKKSSTTGRR